LKVRIPLLFNPKDGHLAGKAAWYSGHQSLSLSRSLAIPHQKTIIPPMTLRFTQRFSNPVNPPTVRVVGACWLGYYFFVKS